MIQAREVEPSRYIRQRACENATMERRWVAHTKYISDLSALRDPPLFESDGKFCAGRSPQGNPSGVRIFKRNTGSFDLALPNRCSPLEIQPKTD